MNAISLAGAYQRLKSAKDILTTLFDPMVDAVAKPKIFDAQGKLGEVHDALFVLRKRLSELQQERDDLKVNLAAAEAGQTHGRRAGRSQLRRLIAWETHLIPIRHCD